MSSNNNITTADNIKPLQSRSVEEENRPASPKRKGTTTTRNNNKNNKNSKKQQPYPRVEAFISEEKQSRDLHHVLRYSLGLYDSPEGLLKRQETWEGLEELLNCWARGLNKNTNEASTTTEAAAAARVALVSFGSYSLQVHKPGADMDLLALCPSTCTRGDFFTTLVKILKADDRIIEVHPIPAAYTPVIKFAMNGIAVDLLFARLTNDERLQQHAKGTNYNITDSDLKDLDEAGVRSLNGARVAQLLDQSVPNQETFRMTLVAVKEWAHVHGLYSNVLGFLGGINYALLVACICRRHQNAQPATLLKAFFQTFAHWNWPTPVTLTLVAYQPPAGVMPLPVWDAKTNKRDGMHLMPILTPTYPSMNSAYNVGIPQLRRLTHALKSGLEVVREIESGAKSWKDLFQNNFFQRHAYFLQTNISASNGNDFLEWFRFVESRLRLLIAGLDNPHYGVQAEPFCKFYDRAYDSKGMCIGPGKSLCENRTESSLFIGLRFDYSVDHVDLSYLVGEFLHKINSWEGRNLGMDLTMETVGRDALPKFLTNTGVEMQPEQQQPEKQQQEPEQQQPGQQQPGQQQPEQPHDDAVRSNKEPVQVPQKEPAVVSWAMKVASGSNKKQDEQLRGMASPAKRART